MKICVGIPSYMPDEAYARKGRQERLIHLLKQIEDLSNELDIILICQNWKDFKLPEFKNKIISFEYEKLGILKARKTLRQKFLELNYDYIIMFDDDAIIEYDNKNAKKEYLKSIKNNPNGFAFVYGGKNPRCPYAPSQLNLCAISKYIYEKEDMVDIDPQLSEGFEDEIFSCLLHYKYPENEFLFPASIKCAHFKNPNINMYGGEVESTWCTNKSLIDWNSLSKNSSEIIDYIKKYKDLPDLKKYKNNKQSLNKKSNSLNYWFDLFN